MPAPTNLRAAYLAATRLLEPLTREQQQAALAYTDDDLAVASVAMKLRKQCADLSADDRARVLASLKALVD